MLISTMHPWRTKAFNLRSWPQNEYKNWNKCSEVTKRTASSIIAFQNPNLNGPANMANFLSYLALKAKTPEVIEQSIKALDEKTTKNSEAWNVIYGFKKSYAKKLGNILNMGLTRKELKNPSPEMLTTAMLYIKWFVNMHMKNWTLDELTVDNCQYVFTGAMLPYFDEIAPYGLRAFISIILEEAKSGIPFVERSRPS